VTWVAEAHLAAKAKNKNAKSVANMSLGGGHSNALDNAVEAVIASGVHFAVAAGNENQDAWYELRSIRRLEPLSNNLCTATQALLVHLMLSLSVLLHQPTVVHTSVTGAHALTSSLQDIISTLHGMTENTRPSQVLAWRHLTVNMYWHSPEKREADQTVDSRWLFGS